jgi:hypothetical protein
MKLSHAAAFAACVWCRGCASEPAESATRSCTAARRQEAPEATASARGGANHALRAALADVAIRACTADKAMLLDLATDVEGHGRGLATASSRQCCSPC